MQARMAMDVADWSTASAAIQLAATSSDVQLALEARLLEAAIACVRREDALAREIMAGIPEALSSADLHSKRTETAGRLALNQGDLTTATTLFRQAILYYNESQTTEKQSGPPAHLYDLLGMTLAMQEDFAAALYYLRQADAIWQALGAPIRRVNTLNNLGALAIEEGRLDDARSHLNEGLALAERYGRRRSQVQLLCGLAELALFETKFDAALALYANASEIATSAQLSAEQAYAGASALRAAVFADDQPARRRWQQALDRLPKAGEQAYRGLVALAQALSEANPTLVLRYLSQAEQAPYLALHDRVLLLLLRAQVIFLQDGWQAAAPHWQLVEQQRTPRHLDALLQVQLARTPQLAAAAGDSALIGRWSMYSVVEQMEWKFFAFSKFAIECTALPAINAVRPIDQLVIIRLLEAGLAGLPALTLWEDVWSDNLYSADALRQSMSRIRRATGLSLQIRQGHCMLLLSWNNVFYDVSRFEAPLRLDPDSSAAAIAALEQQIQLYRGAFLSHLHHESAWLEQRRTMLQQRLLNLHEKLALLVEVDDPQRALQLYTAVFEEDACREMAAAGAMRCALQLGNRLKALMLYQQACTELVNRLGVDPSPVLEQLYRQIA
jgi:tetratricopeptide (TPR) repeat protein